LLLGLVGISRPSENLWRVMTYWPPVMRIEPLLLDYPREGADRSVPPTSSTERVTTLRIAVDHAAQTKAVEELCGLHAAMRSPVLSAERNGIWRADHITAIKFQTRYRGLGRRTSRRWPTKSALGCGRSERTPTGAHS
jgi:hypothetical protein